ncbi:amino acid synthesis family protein [Mesorhizobium sp. YC-39]|uniref:Amino acid synthesis family protein n=1 Tax=Mesorhizobium robiniae TaxID=559315 RepID=A0ABV2GZ04_9HYPH|nr:MULTISPECIES: amino acid synthesis family protein [unclassified Mesorhizobium]MCV3211356.1 amino acid synthesis family protein [Mesorhizobium sp. YC-2]MCV3233081.1 amino acid synthesis family protein [Mesorhizobium sp. YC-39]MCV3243639.1 amino acid synthesis family protein [Mesorhizobium sp. ZC-5]
MRPAIRKTVTYIENTLIEGGKAAPKPLRLIGVAAVLTNPWAGRGFTDDLSPEIRALAPVLGEMLTREIIAVAGSGEAIEGYGKAAICGTSGEIEHASALIHTLHFGNHYRRAVGAKTYLAFTNLRGGPNTPIMIPLMDKNDDGRRSHYLTVHFQIGDAPGPDELVVALGASIGGRPHHRIGDRYQDLKEVGDLHG